jgi:hypothetical protein
MKMWFADFSDREKKNLQFFQDNITMVYKEINRHKLTELCDELQPWLNQANSAIVRNTNFIPACHNGKTQFQKKHTDNQNILPPVYRQRKHPNHNRNTLPSLHMLFSESQLVGKHHNPQGGSQKRPALMPSIHNFHNYAPGETQLTKGLSVYPSANSNDSKLAQSSTHSKDRQPQIHAQKKIAHQKTFTNNCFHGYFSTGSQVANGTKVELHFDPNPRNLAEPSLNSNGKLTRLWKREQPNSFLQNNQKNKQIKENPGNAKGSPEESVVAPEHQKNNTAPQQ